MPDIILSGNETDFVGSACNLGIIFNAIVDKVYGMLRSLWAVIYSTPFARRMLTGYDTYIPEIFAKCDTDDRRKLNSAYNNLYGMYLLRDVEPIYHNFRTRYLELILINIIYLFIYLW